MQFLRVGLPGRERPAARGSDGRLWDLSSLTADIDAAFLAGNGLDRARDALAAGRLQPLPQSQQGQRIAAPIARPGAVVCVGQNYAAHAAETGSPPPTTPIMFLKHPNTVVGPYDDILLPRGSSQVDWEVELGVVMGRPARYLDAPEDAAACIAGYTVSNDVTERSYQFNLSGGQWSKGKCCETFNPLGPWLVPADEVPDPQALRIESRVNGGVRQQSTTADMIFSVHYLVWHLSQFLVLEPGDLLNTGTPEGVALSGRFPYLEDGDVVVCTIDSLGEQRQAVRAGSAGGSPGAVDSERQADLLS